jgi:hypothetical protein
MNSLSECEPRRHVYSNQPAVWWRKYFMPERGRLALNQRWVGAVKLDALPPNLPIGEITKLNQSAVKSRPLSVLDDVHGKHQAFASVVTTASLPLQETRSVATQGITVVRARLRNLFVRPSGSKIKN